MSSGGFEWRSNPEHHEAQERMAHLDAYYAWALDMFGPDFQGPAVDAGAGIGHFSSILANAVSPLLLLEGGQENLTVLERRFSDRDDVQVKEIDLRNCQADIAAFGAKSIFTLDVLEHLPDDVAVLAQFREALPPGGRVYIKVPALSWLYGRVDEASGHYRRYSTTSLRRAVEISGLTVLRCRYMNLAGVPPYFLKSRILKRGENFSRTFSVRQIKRIRKAIPFLRILDRVTGPPLGLSVICIAQRD